MLTIFMSAVRVYFNALKKYLHRELWMEKHRIPYYFGSYNEFMIHQSCLRLRYRIEVEEGKNFDEEMARWRRETTVLIRDSGICKARI